MASATRGVRAIPRHPNKLCAQPHQRGQPLDAPSQHHHVSPARTSRHAQQRRRACLKRLPQTCRPFGSTPCQLRGGRCSFARISSISTPGVGRTRRRAAAAGVSDDHEGVKAAIARVLGWSWQRCAAALRQRHALPMPPATGVAWSPPYWARVFNAENQEQARERIGHVIPRLASIAPKPGGCSNRPRKT